MLGPDSRTDFLQSVTREDLYGLPDPLDPFNPYGNFGYPDAHRLGSESTTNATALADPDLSSTWSDPSQYTPNSLHLYGTTPASSLDYSSARSSQSDLDPYYNHDRDALDADVHAGRSLPSIHIQTELSHLSNATPTFASMHSPYERSPSALTIPTPPSCSSSIGSYPPVTPQSPYGIPPFGTPFIEQPCISPTSPATFAIAPLSTVPKQENIYSPAQPQRVNVHERVLVLAEMYTHPYGGELIPQLDYKPHTQSDRRRYVDQVELEAPILFFMNKGLGIPLKEAITQRFKDLDGRDDPMFEGRGPSVSIRLNWPGYPPWTRQIPTRDFRSPPHPVTRAKLARNVAKVVKRFIEENQNRQLDDPTQARWRVGGNHIHLEDLILVGLQHVSMGSWQAHLRLVRRR